MRHSIYFIVSIIFFLSCSSPIKNNHKPVFITESRLQELKSAIENKTEPQYTAFIALRKRADNNLDHLPNPPKIWYVPGYYRDAEGHRKAKEGLQIDANLSYTLALCYRMTGEKKYADTAIRIINAWSTKVDSMARIDDSLLSFSYHFPAMIFAADLLREAGVWPQQQQQLFFDFIRDKAYNMNTMDRKNNWGNWGLVLASACSAYLEDQERLFTCAKRWKFFIDTQIDENGELPHEIHRNEGRSGVWYSHFCLMPQTLAAEILRNNGFDLFDYTAPNGRSLKQAYSTVANWSANPADFPYWDGDPDQLSGYNYFSYFEILNQHWTNETAQQLLKSNRPMTARHSAPYLTFTHGLPLK